MLSLTDELVGYYHDKFTMDEENVKDILSLTVVHKLRQKFEKWVT